VPPKKNKTFDLKEACVQAAREVIAEQGVEGLSMRDVARKLGISHQAPYRHFESRDHLLAEIMRRCFVDFADHLDHRAGATARMRTWARWAMPTSTMRRRNRSNTG
jgi:AcrR family transcriptional regulator